MLPLPQTPDPELLDAPELTEQSSALVELVELVRVSPRQSQMFCWPAGTHVVALRGRVQLTETPEWQGETLLRPCFALQAHAGHTLHRDGWVLVLAHEDAVLRVVRPALAPAALQGAASLWQRALGWLGMRPAKFAD
jgi:hypothetical protein